MDKKNIIISGINLFEGGPLSIIKDCLSFLNKSAYQKDYNLIALVHKKSLFLKDDYINIKFIEFPKSRKSYAYRLYYEYLYFKKIAKKYKPVFWLSLHDITPNISYVPQAVYCHNPSPFNTLNMADINLQPTQFFFRLFYKYLYKINIDKNKYVIVQQLWIKNEFKKMFKLNRNQIIIAPPKIPNIENKYLDESNRWLKNKETTKNIFFFPTFPRPFKNIEVICEAIKLVLQMSKKDFSFIITLDGTENKYAKSIFKKYKYIENIKFIGLVNRNRVYELYSKCDVLIFPSKLETWGLPISEFKQFKKPMFVADLKYAKETVGNYEYACFFKPNDAYQLSQLIINAIEKKLVFDKTNSVKYEQPVVNDWDELFTTLLK